MIMHFITFIDALGHKYMCNKKNTKNEGYG